MQIKPPTPPQRPIHRNHLIVLTTLLAAWIAYLLLDGTLTEPHRRVVAIFIIAAVFWATEALPLFATSLCVIGLEILLLARHGGLSSTGDLRYEQFLAPFSSGIIILFMGGFLLSAAVTKHGIDRAIAARVLRPFLHSPRLLIYGIMGITAFFSMWMSNTATTTMMLAIVAPLILQMRDQDRFKKAVILSVAFGANIGGIGTPIGTPPNAVAMAALHQAGHKIRFIDWMLIAVPLEVLLIGIVGWLLHFFFPPTTGLVVSQIEDVKEIKPQGKLTLVVLLVSITLWLTGAWHGVAPAVVALLAAGVLTAFRVLDRHDVDSINWNVLILMWGGLSLGYAMTLTGLTDEIQRLPIAQMQGFVLAAIVVGLSVGLSTFISNTAAANLIIPIVITFAPDQRVSLVILTAMGCSFAMAMPVSTPPNAIVFATGNIPAASFVRAGGVISVISVVVLLLGYQIILPLFLDMN